MNAGMTIATILSLALALAVAGDATTHRGSVSGSPSGPRGVNLNHNETTVRDAMLVGKGGGSCPPMMCNHNETFVRDTSPSQPENTWTLWMGGEQTFLDAFLASLSFYRAGVQCSPWICGSNHSETLVRDTGTRGHNLNHNETLVSDTTSRAAGGYCSPWVCGSNHNETLIRDKEAKAGTGANCPSWICGGNHSETIVRATQSKTSVGGSCSPWICGSNHNETLVRDKVSARTAGVQCSPWICGSNHNETLVSDAAPEQPAELWSLWTSVGQAFADASHIFPSLTYRAGVQCSPWVCGSNHNETLVRDAAPLK